jgi:hypothetical protein
MTGEKGVVEFFGDVVLSETVFECERELVASKQRQLARPVHLLSLRPHTLVP